jgi:hypothetical protein
MQTVYLNRNFDYRMHPRRMVRFSAGVTYARVIEAAARQIEHHGAGHIVERPSSDVAGIDASAAFRPRKRGKR